MKAKSTKNKKRLLGEVCVDTGTIMIADQCLADHAFLDKDKLLQGDMEKKSILVNLFVLGENNQPQAIIEVDRIAGIKMKICTKCKIEREEEDGFYFENSKQKYSSWCKICHRENINNRNKNKKNIIDKMKENIEGGMKICTKCSIKKQENDFSIRSDTKKLRATCKECTAKRLSNWHNKNLIKRKKQNRGKYIKNKFHINKKHKEWKKNNPEYFKDYRLKKNHNLTREEFNFILFFQNFRCAICKEFPDNRGWCIDHDHETNINRGILCNPCNSALGFLRDNISRIEEAFNYIDSTSIAKIIKGAFSILQDLSL